MPNWCFNHLEIHSSSEGIQALMQHAKGAVSPHMEQETPFSVFPFVKHLLPTEYEDDWYKINIKIVGCEWFPAIEPAAIHNNGECVTVTFETPWSPSKGATRQIAAWLKSHSYTFSITHAYDESGCCFCGLITIDNDGEDEQEGSYSNLSSDAIAEVDDDELASWCVGFDVTPEELRDRAKNDDFVILCPEFYQDHA